jgi:hypothetical protein
MRLLQGVLLVAIVACVAAAYQQTFTFAALQPSATPTPLPSATPAQEASIKEVNDRYAKQILERIAGREKEAAAKVFKNIQLEWLKDVPAAQLINIMNFGYSRALGVACTHCHVEQDFGSDDKRPKRAAREMAVMHRMINDQLVKMQSLEVKPEERFVNCATCHRGAINPRTIPSAPRPAGK